MPDGAASLSPLLIAFEDVSASSEAKRKPSEPGGMVGFLGGPNKEKSWPFFTRPSTARMALPTYIGKGNMALSIF